jgi:outer membrane protein OmpA-like peptidoglycan-associated protein
MITAICLFLVGACAGAFMVFRHLKKLRLPGWVAIAHGLAGATGFTVLLLFCLREPAVVLARWALGILIGAIALGCVNVVYHLRGVRHRLVLIATHALVAVSGVGTLAYAAIVHAQRPDLAPLPAVPEPAPRAAPVPIAQQATPTPGPVAANAVNPLNAANASGATAAMPTGTSAAAGAATPHASAHAVGPAWGDLRVRFDSAQERPTPASDATLATIAQALADDPSIRLVEVQGHADQRGAEPANLDLTRARARAVVAALVARGVAPSRLRSAGYGSHCPARGECRAPDAPTACHGDDALREDRRVTFVVVDSGGQKLAGPMACDLGGGS